MSLAEMILAHFYILENEWVCAEALLLLLEDVSPPG